MSDQSIDKPDDPALVSVKTPTHSMSGSQHEPFGQMQNVFVSFVVPALNEAALIGRCLLSIKAQRLPAGLGGIEIIVVDTGSEDNTTQIAEDLGASVIRLPQNTPIAEARNVGAKTSRGNFIAFIDADCELDSNWISVSMEHFSEGTTAAVGSILAPPSDNATWVERAWYRLGYKRPPGIFSKVEWLPTLNMLVARSQFEAAGGFNESLVTCEDQDLGRRLRKFGDIVLDTRVPARHLRESKTLYELFRREAWRGRSSYRSLLLNDHPIQELPSIIAPLIFLAALIATIVSSVISLVDPSYVALIITAAIVLVSIPGCYLIRKRPSIDSPLEFSQMLLLTSVYLFARGLANLKFPSERLPAPKSPDFHPDPEQKEG